MDIGVQGGACGELRAGYFLGMYPQCNKACPQSLGKPPFVPGCTAHSAPSSPSGAVKEEKSLTLTTHAIVGAAIVHFMPSHPLAAVCLAFASHFLLDAFPHWDYPIWSTSLKPSIASPMKYDRALFTDMLTIGTDAALGVVLAFILFTRQESLFLVFCGAFAAILPDFLQFAYMRFPREPLTSMQQFHRWIHTSQRMQPLFGIISQFAFVIVFMVAVRALLPS